MKAIQFHPDAETELIEAAVWYEGEQRDLGRRFLAAVQDAIERIRINPLLFSTVEGDVRRCLTKPDLIAIMAVMHLRRDPMYWRDRLIDFPKNPPEKSD